MRPSAQPCSASPSLSLPELEQFWNDWLLEGEIRQHSLETSQNRRGTLTRLIWFLRDQNLDTCGTSELRRFLAYVSAEPAGDEGRWGLAQCRRKARPQTVQTYHAHLRAFFRWLESEELIDGNPMAKIKPPVVRQDQVQPFTQDQVRSLLEAARNAKYLKRDIGILTLLLDTGVRASELCSLRIKDLDLQGRRFTVQGKGNKVRTLYFGREALKALRGYLAREPRDPEDPVFIAEKGEAFTRSGLRQLLERLGAAAGVQSMRCSPHTCRHTFAVSFLRAGGNLFSLQQLLGHTDLRMTRRYVALAEADLETQSRAFSPMDHLGARTHRRQG